jgi:hypothetical protein
MDSLNVRRSEEMDLLYLQRSGETDLHSPDEEIHFSRSFQIQEIHFSG